MKQITIKQEQLDVINHLVKNEHLTYSDAIALLNNEQLIRD